MEDLHDAYIKIETVKGLCEKAEAILKTVDTLDGLEHPCISKLQSVIETLQNDSFRIRQEQDERV